MRTYTACDGTLIILEDIDYVTKAYTEGLSDDYYKVAFKSGNKVMISKGSRDYTTIPECRKELVKQIEIYIK